MFSPARLTAASQRGSPDVASSSCQRKRTVAASPRAAQSGLPTPLAEGGRTHVIRPGPGFRETSVTSWPLAFSSWVRAVPMKPVPPPDQKIRDVYPPGGAFRPACSPPSGAIPFDPRLLSFLRPVPAIHR